jgi:hypothetical protein
MIELGSDDRIRQKSFLDIRKRLLLKGMAARYHNGFCADLAVRAWRTRHNRGDQLGASIEHWLNRHNRSLFGRGRPKERP